MLSRRRESIRHTASNQQCPTRTPTQSTIHDTVLLIILDRLSYLSARRQHSSSISPSFSFSLLLYNILCKLRFDNFSLDGDDDDDDDDGF